MLFSLMLSRLDLVTVQTGAAVYRTSISNAHGTAHHPGPGWRTLWALRCLLRFRGVPRFQTIYLGRSENSARAPAGVAALVARGLACAPRVLLAWPLGMARIKAYRRDQHPSATLTCESHFRTLKSRTLTSHTHRVTDAGPTELRQSHSTLYQRRSGAGNYTE